MEEHFISSSWTYGWWVFSGTENNGYGILIVLNNREHRKLSFATGECSYGMEAEPLKISEEALISENSVKENLVFLTDAVSIVTALKSYRNEMFRLGLPLWRTNC